MDEEGPPELVEAVTAEQADDASATPDPRLTKVPITVVTEFGDSADVEKALTINHDGEQVSEWLDLANGCICCSVKDSGVNAIESLMERRGAFDYILLETTGLADPGNIAPIFWVDDGLGSTIYLDGIVTLVDAKNVLKSLDEPAPQEEVTGDAAHEEISNISSAAPTHDHDHANKGPVLTTAHLQISHADVIIINKSDLVSPSDLQQITERIGSINGVAKIHKTSHSQVPSLEKFILDIHAYDGLTDLSMFESKGHSHLDPTISTVTIPLPPIDPRNLPHLDAWLRSVLWESKIPGSPAPSQFEIHRLKGFVPCTDGTARVVQGVREIFDIVEAKNVDPERLGEGKIVLIGRGLASVPWETSGPNRGLRGSS